MIFEPEMVGDFPASPEPETLTSEEHCGTPRGRRPWLWAVGGALTASAVWAGGLYATGATGAEPGPDTRGYRLGKGLCAKAELAGLELSLGKKSGDPLEMVSEHSALDKVICEVHFPPTGKLPKDGGFTVSYKVDVVAELHKKTDPEPEFEAILGQPVWGDGVPARTEEVPGLGEKAYLLPPAGIEGPRLRVLDGGAVIDLHITPSIDEFYGDEGPTGDVEPEPDMSALPPLMIEDMRDLMAALKR